MKKRASKAKLRFSAAKKNLDLMRLLVSHAEFQKDVAEAREYLRIPPKGFPDDSQMETWTEELCQRSEDMMNSREFNRKLRKITDSYNKGEIGGRMKDKQSRMIHFDIPVNYLTYTCQFLTEKYHIPEHFSDDIRRYIIWGIISAPLNNFRGGMYPPGKLPSEVRYIPMNIYSQLTDNELQDLKREIKLMGKHLPKFKPLKNIEKKLTIEKWYNNRRKFDEVSGKAYNMNAAEISENIMGNNKNKKRVYEAVREVKDLRSKRFGN